MSESAELAWLSWIGQGQREAGERAAFLAGFTAARSTIAEQEKRIAELEAERAEAHAIVSRV